MLQESAQEGMSTSPKAAARSICCLGERGPLRCALPDQLVRLNALSAGCRVAAGWLEYAAQLLNEEL